MTPPLPKAFIDNAWSGLPRNCPKCGTEFLSKFNCGRCPNCTFIFHASEVYGPPNVDLVQLKELAIKSAIVSTETSNYILKLLTVPADALPERPVEFENLDRFTSPTAKADYVHLREVWDWSIYFLEQAIANGGKLFRYSSSAESWEARMGSSGYAVVQDGRITACMTIAMN